MIQRADKVYTYLKTHFNFFRTDDNHEKNFARSTISAMKDHIVIVGGHQMGLRLLHELEDEKDKIVIVDFDPDIVKKLEKKHEPVVFGDIADPDIQDHVHLDKAKLVISTAPDLEDNLLVLESIKQRNKKAKVIVMALENEDAKALYKAGADYVILPHLAGGRYLARILKDDHLENLDWHKARDLVYIN
jgi:Trk K+ transport system NAD-binding subunit